MVTIVILLLIVIAIWLFMYHPQFGRKPYGDRLARIVKSPNYKDGQFQNLVHTPQLTEGYTISQVLYEFLFKRKENRSPKHAIPSVKTDLRSLPLDRNVLVWFGHSSYYFHLDGVRFLVDPVLSGSASPLPYTNRSFKGADVYAVDDLPDIDVLLITHDHYDHVDYKTLKAIRPRVGRVITGLGVGGHLERWGFESNRITECDWNETIDIRPGYRIHTIPTRHFSGRSFSRNNTLWLSFLLESPSMKLYVGGDSGYSPHFKEVGDRFGKIDLAILENGQYDKKWKYIHFHPNEVLQAAKDLHAQRVMPVHSGKFMMANHAWDEPLSLLWELNEAFPIPLVTPRIGEAVELGDDKQVFGNWWEAM